MSLFRRKRLVLLWTCLAAASVVFALSRLVHTALTFDAVSAQVLQVEPRRFGDATARVTLCYRVRGSFYEVRRVDVSVSMWDFRTVSGFHSRLFPSWWRSTRSKWIGPETANALWGLAAVFSLAALRCALYVPREHSTARVWPAKPPAQPSNEGSAAEATPSL